MVKTQKELGFWKMHLIWVLLCFITLGIISCDSDKTTSRDALLSILGQKIEIPEKLEYRVNNESIVYDFDDADYKIVTYINSEGCTPCRMKLKDWNSVINKAKGFRNVEVNFLMIVNADNWNEIDYMIKQSDFRHPVMIDSVNTFFTRNSLPKRTDCHTMLLDESNRVIAVGNPVLNPKIRTLFYKLISEGEDSLQKSMLMCQEPTKAIGIIHPGDTIEALYRIKNIDTLAYSIEELVPSCDCTEAVIDADSILPNNYARVKITYIADSVQGSFIQYADLYIKEKFQPLRLQLHGFIKNYK